MVRYKPREYPDESRKYPTVPRTVAEVEGYLVYYAPVEGEYTILRPGLREEESVTFPAHLARRIAEALSLTDPMEPIADAAHRTEA